MIRVVVQCNRRIYSSPSWEPDPIPARRSFDLTRWTMSALPPRHSGSVAYFGAWRWIGFKLGMAQGAAQFCRASAFRVLNGYDESQFMGEDVDFSWRLRRLCARTRGHVQLLADVKVVPSPRRFDTAPVWRTLIWTNPVFIWAFRKTRSAWAQWYVTPPR